MKRKDLIKKLKENGWYFKRQGGEHEIYTDGIASVSVPRHKEISELTAKEILKQTDIQ